MTTGADDATQRPSGTRRPRPGRPALGQPEAGRPRLGQQRLARERGIVKPRRRAIGAESAAEGVRLGGVRIVLVGTREAGNLGQVARAMLNMGLTRLTLVAPVCAPRSAEARRRAMHAWEIIKHADTVGDLGTALADTIYSIAFTTGSARSEARPVPFEVLLDDLTTLSAQGDVALVFGNEVDGLSNGDLRQCSARARLMTSPELPSLNLAQAVLLAAHHVYTHRRSPTAPAAPGADDAATAAELERLWARLWLTLDRTRALPLQNPRRFFGRIRASLSRQVLTTAEVKVWLGVLGDVLKALDHPHKIKPTAATEPWSDGPKAGDTSERPDGAGRA